MTRVAVTAIQMRANYCYMPKIGSIPLFSQLIVAVYYAIIYMVWFTFSI